MRFFYIVQNAFDPPPPLPFEHLEENFRPLRGHFLGFYELNSAVQFEQGV